MSDHDAVEHTEEGRRVPIALIVVGVLVVAAAIFVAQNTDEVGFEFLGFDFGAPLWLMLVAVFLLGAVAGQAAMWYRRRRARRAHADG